MNMENTENIQANKEFMWMPFCVNCQENYIDALSHHLEEYKTKFVDQNNVSDIKSVETLFDSLPQIVSEYVNGLHSPTFTL